MPGMNHYRLEAHTARHAVFSSTWGECIVIDRATLRSVYSQDEQGRASVVECLMISNRGQLDEYAAPLIEVCGDAALTINTLADVRATLDALADLERLRECAAKRSRHLWSGAFGASH